MTFTPLMSTSKDQTWATPWPFFSGLNDEFTFTLDPCAEPATAKCERFFTPEDDGLSQSWAGETVFMNPPYGRAIGRWVEKAWREAVAGATVVALIPVRSSAAYWHRFVMRSSEIRFVIGRMKFGGTPTGRGHNAPFDSAIIVFRPRCEGPPVVGAVGRDDGLAA